MNSLKVCAMLLLSFLCNDIAVSSLKSSTITHALASPSISNAIAENTETQSPSIVKTERVKQLLNEGQKLFENQRFLESELTLRKALDLLNGEIGNSLFQAPKVGKADLLTQILNNIKTILCPQFICPKAPPKLISVDFQPVMGSLDEVYIAIINSLALGNQPNLDIAQNPPDNLQSQEIQNVEDIHKIELKILHLLQQTLIAQRDDPNKIGQALEFAESARNLELLRVIPAYSYALNDKVQKRQLTYEGIRDFAPPNSLNVGDIQEIAKNSRSTLVYYSVVSNKKVLAWIIKPNSQVNVREIYIEMKDSPIDSVLQAAASFVRRGESGQAIVLEVRNQYLTAKKSTQSEQLANFLIAEAEQKKKLRDLYQTLIDPIKDLLPTEPDEHVVFIPQGSLLLTPFPALLDNNEKYLIDSHTIRIAPSLQNLKRNQNFLKKFPMGKEEILIVSNPPVDNAPNLRGAEREAYFIGQITQSPPLIGKEATRAKVLQLASNAKVLHFATHGAFDNQRFPLDDIMLLININSDDIKISMFYGKAKPNSGGNRFSYSLWSTSDNSLWHLIRTKGAIPGAFALANVWLTSKEILSIKLNADLVVLSACETAKGIATEDTLLGIPFALGIAGARRVIVSLWSVPDIATQNLMEEFYRDMRRQGRANEAQGRNNEGIDEAKALRKAMLYVKNMENKKGEKQYADPINWAGFMLLDVSRNRD